jgi:TRAP-type C4-dicarboxylate transport system permease small subunit
VHELAILAVVVAFVMAATAAAARLVGRALLVMEYALVSVSVLVILFVMAFVGAEVFMRYVLNSPIPGHLELSELMMPVIVFLALSYTQSTHGHVGMELVLDALPPAARRLSHMGVLLASIFICAVLAYFSFKHTYQLWLYDDVTMTPPYFKTWPSAAAIPLGYALISLRMFIQVLHLFDPGRFPASEPAAATFHAPE